MLGVGGGLLTPDLSGSATPLKPLVPCNDVMVLPYVFQVVWAVHRPLDEACAAAFVIPAASVWGSGWTVSLIQSLGEQKPPLAAGDAVTHPCAIILLISIFIDLSWDHKENP